MNNKMTFTNSQIENRHIAHSQPESISSDAKRNGASFQLRAFSPFKNRASYNTIYLHYCSVWYLL